MRLLLALLLLPIAAQAQSCNRACEARKAEPHLLKPGQTERHGDRLVVITKPGKLVFDDNKRACEDGNANDCAIYDVAAALPFGVVIRKFGLEGSDSWLIDTASGRKTVLTGAPVFAPDGRRFIVGQFSNDSDNNLEVWQRDGDAVRLEWAHPFKQSFAEDPALLHYPSDPKLALPPVFQVTSWQGDRITLAVSTDDQKYHWTGSLVRDAKGWHLSAKSPPGLLKRE
jgi:hypothetical protein